MSELIATLHRYKDIWSRYAYRVSELFDNNRPCNEDELKELDELSDEIHTLQHYLALNLKSLYSIDKEVAEEVRRALSFTGKRN